MFWTSASSSGKEERGCHHADGRRQADEPVVDVGEQRGQADEGGD